MFHLSEGRFITYCRFARGRHVHLLATTSWLDFAFWGAPIFQCGTSGERSWHERFLWRRKFSHEKMLRKFPRNFRAFIFVGPKKFPPNSCQVSLLKIEKITDELLQERRENDFQSRGPKTTYFEGFWGLWDWKSGRPKNAKSNHDGSNPPFSALCSICGDSRWWQQKGPGNHTYPYQR